MEKIKILIVEDESIIAEDLREIIESLKYHVVGVAFSAKRAIEMLDREKPDLVLIDIILNGLEGGIYIANLINEKYKIPFVFVTSHADHATLEKARATRPAGYVVKPFGEKDIFAAIEIALFNFSNQQKKSADVESTPTSDEEFVINDNFFIKDGGRYTKVGFNEIKWVKADGNYVEVQTLQKKFLLRSPLKNILVQLPENSYIRVHKSYAVFKKFITKIEQNNIYIDDIVIPIGRKFKEELFKELGID
jgi:DNA-binding LytR/AlgR family response regulator